MFFLFWKIADERLEGKVEGVFSTLLTPVSSLLGGGGAKS
jgi:hypothetical protein